MATTEIQPVPPKPPQASPAPQAAPASACKPINVRWQWGMLPDGSPLSGVITVTDAKTPQEAIETIAAIFKRRLAIYATPAPEPSPKPKPQAEKPADKPKKKPISPNKTYGQPKMIDGDVIDVTKGEPGLSPSRK